MKSNRTDRKDRLLTRNDWCELCGISRNTLKKWLRNGIIPPPIPTGTRGDRWPYSDYETFASRA